MLQSSKIEAAQTIAVRQDHAEATVDTDDEPTKERHWFHKPYPFNGAVRILKVTALGLALIVFVQIMYPSGLTLPLSRLQSNGYNGFQSKSKLEHKIYYINRRTIAVHTKTGTVKTTPLTMGARANADRTFSELADYPFEQRLIPFSILFKSASPKLVSRDIDVDKLSTFTKDIVTVTKQEPRNAEVRLQGTKFVISPSQDGFEYNTDYVRRQLATNPLGSEDITIEAKSTAAQLSTSSVENSVAPIQKRIDSGFTISAGEQSIRIGPETIASWVIIDSKPNVNTVAVTFDRQKVASSLQSLNVAVNQNGSPDQITLLNGSEAGRKVGVPGRTLQFDDLVNQVSSATDWTVGVIQAKVVNEPLKQVYNRTYSRDSTGLQNLLDYWSKNNKGRYGIAVQSQNGRLQATYNSYQNFNGAYRIYLPHLVYGKINARAINPGTNATGGFTVDGCIDKLVLNNNDNCAAALGELVGWSESNSMLAAQGLTGTSLVRGNGGTTANDGAQWAQKLLDGSLTTATQKSNLISMMSQQSLRNGIPAGIRGVGIANRAGQAGAVRYDVAIVYHSQGAYILSIFSDGGSFASFADLATQVNQVMSQ